ncbi:hypothetical protein CFIMG_003025RA [Ceratocystis fimbriata CBS 114723]|uniref:M protein repeat protein n=1 Tax=Ceratocystis fimbriata CBS 114723 TaxID=1035309 RepID=A0A2C5XA67_9PEZI|nr:hypothetical protein CFIMG_003025RA [Ceratocystis fimbriata CBS 114723]
MDEKQRAEKLAAARKKAQQMKKAKKEKKEKVAEGTADKPVDQENPKKEDAQEDAVDAEPSKAGDSKAPEEPTEDIEPADDTAAATTITSDDSFDKPPADNNDASSNTASLAEQSKMRSSSFRKNSTTSMSPPPQSAGLAGVAEAEARAADIYRKQTARIEELEKENKRLGKDAADAEKRWKKAEEELEDLREQDGGNNDDDEVAKLKEDNESLERQIKQLQSQLTRRQSSSAAPLPAGLSPTALQEQIDSKTTIIESMEAELSTLRGKLERTESGSSSEKEQITALEEKLLSAEKKAEEAQNELVELKKNIDRTAEKAVREGSERTSIETKLHALENELAEKQAALVEAEKKVDALEKKISALTTLHKEQETRSQGLRKEKEAADKQLLDLKLKLERADSENLRLKTRKSTDGGGGLDDDGVDELEDEGRRRLEQQVRDMEAEISELRRGIWRTRRKSLASGADGTNAAFHDVDLNSAPPTHSHSRKPTQTGSGFGEFLTSGLNALAGTGGHDGGLEEDDSFLSDDDEAGLDFDEDAFRHAQAEEAKVRLERMKELKRGLKNWEGWRLDMVDTRKGVQGFGDVFEI